MQGVATTLKAGGAGAGAGTKATPTVLEVPAFNCTRTPLKAAVSSSNENEQKPVKCHAKTTGPMPTIKNRASSRKVSTKAVLSKPNVCLAYSIVSRNTGSLGGSASGGPIYEELTRDSMQKLINIMKECTGLDKNSRFIDVGSGLGKPSIHVAQDPGVAFSYGIEMEEMRWYLGMQNLKGVLSAAVDQWIGGGGKGAGKLGYRCIFDHGDITEASFFDPFTHVYMFDVGFPPVLLYRLGVMFNRSESEYLICFHAPNLVIDEYDFHVDLIAKSVVSMHGSQEAKTAYFYRRRILTTSPYEETGTSCPSGGEGLPNDIPCDPRFADAWRVVGSDLCLLSEFVNDQTKDKAPPGLKNRLRSARKKRKHQSKNRISARYMHGPRSSHYPPLMHLHLE